MKVAVTAASLALAACAQPASSFEDSLSARVDGPPSELEIRSGSVDLFEFATQHWRFYDDYLDLQPPACPDDSDGGTLSWPYLWRHGVESSDLSFANGRLYGWRAGLDVSRDLVVLQTNDRLWTFVADGGTPLHADLGTRVAGGPDMAVFGTDSLLWTDGSGAPSLIDLSSPRDRSSGWKVIYSWREAHGQDSQTDHWYQPAPAVQRDGTLIWTSGAGVTRALTLSGTVKWEAPAAEGPFLVTTDDVVIRSERGDYVAIDDDGGVRWHASPPPGTTGPVGLTQVDEGRHPSNIVPMLYSSGDREVLVTRRARDGALLATLDPRDAGAFGGPRVTSVDPEGALIINAIVTTNVFTLSSRTPAMHERWRVPARELEFAPLISSAGDRLLTIDTECRVSLIDRATGVTLATHRMIGRPGRFLPRYRNGVLYVVAELRPGVTVKPSQLQGRRRPDGGVIEVSDYGCYSPAFLDGLKCPSVEADNRRRVFALYAFQVD